MQRTCLFSFLILMLSFHSEAQKRKTFKIQPGEKLVEVIPNNEQYSYPEFRNANIYFRQNTYSAAKLNYNNLYGEMQFIDPKGDTLSMSDESTIKIIVIEPDTFYYDKGYMQQLADYGEIKLVKKVFFTFVNRQ